MFTLGKDARGRDVKLPEEIFTSTTAILGMRGMGKSTTARVLVEEATQHGVPSAIPDVTGVWWGLKSSVDGKSAGLPFYVFGGDHADVPLEPEGGSLIGEFFVQQRVPIVCDVSQMRKGRRVHFVAEFLEEV